MVVCRGITYQTEHPDKRITRTRELTKYPDLTKLVAGTADSANLAGSDQSWETEEPPVQHGKQPPKKDKVDIWDLPLPDPGSYDEGRSNRNNQLGSEYEATGGPDDMYPWWERQ